MKDLKVLFSFRISRFSRRPLFRAAAVITVLAVIFHSPVFARMAALHVTAYDAPVRGVAAAIAGELKAGSVVLLGEFHTSYAGHLKKTEILQQVIKTPENVSPAIGLEMFPRSAQPVLDDYIARKIDEFEFLKRSHYFEEWGYDYRLYKPLIDFARQNGLRLVGLNLENRLARKIGREGLGGLSAGEMASLPQIMNFSGGDYRERLRLQYNRHVEMLYGNKPADDYDFQNFYLAQLVRDEYMARSAALFLREHPKTPLVIVAGNGHIIFGDGIPSRLTRLSGRQTYSVLFDQPYDPEAAGHFVYTKEAEFTGSPKLFIILDLTGEKPVVTKIDSRASEAQPPHPLREGDEIVAVDGQSVASLAGIKLALYRKEYGQKVVIEVIREGQKTTVEYVLKNYDE